MRILVASDKFKGSLGAKEASESIAIGLREVLPAAAIRTLPIADGGEGTVEIIQEALGAEWMTCTAHDSLGRIMEARYAWCGSGRTAFVEMSETAGLRGLPQHERDPMRTSTFGVGEMLCDAIRCAPAEIVVGLGGSATNDGGFGMARALGFHFLDRDNVELTGSVSDLLKLERIESPQSLSLPRMAAAADVRNHLLGERGATRVFGPQKGASAEDIELLEEALTRLAEIVARDLDVDYRDKPGAGAAGGLGFGLMSFCAAEIRSGFDVVAEHVGLKEAVRHADIVITGEGKLDAQTLDGKALAGISRLARAAGKPVFAIVGNASGEARQLFDAVFILAEPPVSEGEAMANAPALLGARSRELARLLQRLA